MASCSVNIKLDVNKIKELDEQLRKMTYSTLQNKSIGLIEMANMTQKLGEMKIESVTGKVINSGNFILLDTNFNNARSWRIPNKFLSSNLKDGDLVTVLFVENKIESIIKGFDSKPEEKPIVRESFIPESGFYVTPDQKRILDVASKAFNDVNNPHKGFVVSLRGKAGTGKTSLAQHFAFSNELPILIIDCSTISDSGDWFLIPGFKNQETVFDKTKLTEFLISGNCVVLFDEINRMPSHIGNALLPILDHRHFTSLRGVDIQVNNKVAFFMTSNHGYEYTGTNPIDQALKRRIIGTIKVGDLPPVVETELLVKRMGLDWNIAESIIKVFVSLRDSELKDYPVNISTSTSLNVAWWVNYGATIRDAFTVSIINDAPEETHKIILDTLNTYGHI